MGRRKVELLIDDLDGTELKEGAGRTVEFAYEGVEYVIDLSSKNAKKFDDAVAPFRDHATRVGRRSRSRGGVTRPGSGRRQQLQAMREWAREEGYEVSDRGRVSREIQDAYEAAH